MNNARETTRLWEWDVVPSLWAINTNYRWKDNLCFCNMVWFYSGFTPDSYITRFVKHVLLWPLWMVSQERWKRLTHSDDSCNLSMINSQIVLLSTKLFPFYWLNTMCIEFSNTHITAIMWSWHLSSFTYLGIFARYWKYSKLPQKFVLISSAKRGQTPNSRAEEVKTTGNGYRLGLCWQLFHWILGHIHLFDPGYLTSILCNAILQTAEYKHCNVWQWAALWPQGNVKSK